MAEVLVAFDSEFVGPDQTMYRASACSHERPDHLWDGWLEFTPVSGGTVVRTGRETTQPNRDAVLYWATGLTTTYIDGALTRALAPPLPKVGEQEIDATPTYEGPATAVATPVLDPFRVYAEGPGVLRGQLDALSADQLRTIARAFRISDRNQLEVATRTELISLIMLAAEKRAA
jgi:hypothetical protein